MGAFMEFGGWDKCRTPARAGNRTILASALFIGSKIEFFADTRQCVFMLARGVPQFAALWNCHPRGLVFIMPAIDPIASLLSTKAPTYP